LVQIYLSLIIMVSAVMSRKNNVKFYGKSSFVLNSIVFDEKLKTKSISDILSNTLKVCARGTHNTPHKLRPSTVWLCATLCVNGIFK